MANAALERGFLPRAVSNAPKGNLLQIPVNFGWNILRAYRGHRALARRWGSALARFVNFPCLRWVVPMEFMNTKRSRAPVVGRRGERGKSPVSDKFLHSKRFADAERQKECARSGNFFLPRG